MVTATPARRGRTYREHGRSVTDVELVHPDGSTVVVEIRGNGRATIHDSHLDHYYAVEDGEAAIAAFKAAGYEEYGS